MTTEMVVDTVSTGGYHIEFNSPITFIVHDEVDPEDGQPLRVAFIEGFEQYSECWAEKDEDLITYAFPYCIIGHLQYPPENDAEEEYVMFYNYLKNSIESITWTPPSGMKITILDGGAAKLEFSKCLPQSQ